MQVLGSNQAYLIRHLNSPTFSTNFIVGPNQLPHMAIRPTITPMLSVNDGLAAIDFYLNAFGASETGRVDNNGKIIITEISFGGTKFYLSDESIENGNISPKKAKGTTIRLELTVPDPDAFVNQAVACGAKVIFPVADQDYGYRQGRIEDPFGHQWVVGRPL
jgi:PhnB protein